MLNLILYIIGLIGMAVLCDAVASIYTYLPDKKQTWKRDHLLRVVRGMYGIVLMFIAGFLITVGIGD